MKSLQISLVALLLFACTPDVNEEVETSETTIQKEKTDTPLPKEKESKRSVSPTIGERIDGPANIRNSPNGKVLFELNDHVLVETTQLKNNWYEILLFSHIEFDEVKEASVEKNRDIHVKGKKVGKILKTHEVSKGYNNDFAFAVLHGYTHKDNIKSETIIENAFSTYLERKSRKYSDWKGFIKDFHLEKDALEYKDLRTYYNYESSVVDPSPGFRLVLLFDKNQLIGWMHSRDIDRKVENTTTHSLINNYSVTFYSDYAVIDQKGFVKYMKEWIKSVS